MSAETLRQAGTLMRERAIWCYADGDLSEWYSAAEVGHILRRSEPEHSRINHDATHIASWHPTIALAVADWLDAAAERYEELIDTFAPGSRAGAVTAALNVAGWEEALTVARAYLGETS